MTDFSSIDEVLFGREAVDGEATTTTTTRRDDEEEEKRGAERGYLRYVEGLGEDGALPVHDGVPVVPLALPSRMDYYRAGYRWDDKGARKRRSFPIRAYCGLNGYGKTLAMVHDAIPSLWEGRPVLSTVRIIDPMTGNDHPLYTEITEWKMLIDPRFEHTTVLFDEILGILGDDGKLPVQARVHMQQLRKADQDVSWTGPSWEAASRELQRITRLVTFCHGYFPRPDRNPDGSKTERLWRNNVLFRWHSFDAEDRATVGGSRDAERKLKGKVNNWVFRPAPVLFGKVMGQPMLASHMYGTTDISARIGAVMDNGRCVYCDGMRRPELCRCDEGQTKWNDRHHHHHAEAA